MIEAVIFDMDGVIINSEPFWVDAEIEVYKKYNVSLTVEMCQQMKGIRAFDVVKHWHAEYKITKASPEEISDEIIDKVCFMIASQGKAMPGLIGLLEYLQNKNVKIGLATSSIFRIVETVMNKLKVSDYFDVLHSAEYEKNGKPAPDVYFGAAKKLGVQPKNCIAIEDSYNGILSAKAAGMFAIAMPDKTEFHEERFGIADVKIKSLKEIIELDFMNKLGISGEIKIIG